MCRDHATTHITSVLEMSVKLEWSFASVVLQVHYTQGQLYVAMNGKLRGQS